MGAVVVAVVVVVVVVDIVVAVVVDVDAVVVQVVPIFAVSTRLNIEPELGINPKLEQVSLYNLSQLSKRSGTRQDIAPSSRRRIPGNSTVQTEWQKTRHENGHSLINAPAAFLIRSGKPPARKNKCIFADF